MRTCPKCIGGYKTCLILRVRTSRCSACGAGMLRCRLCYDAPNASPCPDCEPDAYEDFVYRRIMREPEKHLNACFRITGRIQRAEMLHEDEAGKVIALTLTEEDADAGVKYTYRVHYFAPAGAMNLLMGDQVTLWGRLIAHTSDQTPQFNVWQAELAE